MSPDRSEATRFEPPESPAGAPFWEASRERRFTLPWCRGCEQALWYPRETCPHCHGTDIEWRPASGRGTVYAASVQHRPANPLMADRVPYVVALIELDEGPRLMTNVVGCASDEVEVGMAVTVTWEALSDGRHLPLFEPA